MKNYHIIYNSSEKGLSGSSGFGVRTVTEGAPQELTAAMADAEMFSFIPLGPSLTPSALQQNPDLVLGIPPQYFFGSVVLNGQQRYYIIGRKVAVGFDYSFYINGNATRPGNYVVDAYAFDSVPEAADFGIFLENAAPGSRHFIPASPAPRSDNEEMRGISVGQQTALPYEQMPFTAKTPAPITPQTLDLLFAFIQSRKTGKPLLLKTSTTDVGSLMAALARLVPPEMLGDMSFISDYSSEGKKKGVNIYLINEFYDQEIFKSQWVYCDFTSGDSVDTPERTVHLGELTTLAAAGDFDTLHSKVRWCMSERFDRYSNIGTDALQQLYNYFHDYNNFALRTVAQNNQFRSALCECFAENPQEQQRLDRSVQASFDKISNLSQMFGWITFVMRSTGVNFDRIVEANRRAMTTMILQSHDNFLAFRKEFKSHYDQALRFIDKDAYNSHLAQSVADSRYSELFEEIFDNYRTDTPDRLRHLTANLCSYSDNPQAAAWARGRGANVIRGLYNAMLSSVKDHSLSDSDAAGICHQFGKSRLPHEVLEPFMPLGLLLMQTENGIEQRLPQIFNLAKELKMNSYLSRIAPKLLQSPAIPASDIVSYFLDNGITTPQRLMVMAKKQAQPQKYWIEVIRHQDLKPKQMLDLLGDINGLMLDDATAMDFLQKYFPEAHDKIEKSRQPSIFTRLFSSFSKKSKDDSGNEHDHKSPKHKK